MIPRSVVVALLGGLIALVPPGPPALSSHKPCDERFHIEQVLEGHIALEALDFSGPTDGWGVGFHYDSEESSTEFGYVVHYDGESWSEGEHPPRPGRGTLELNSVSALAPDQVWVSGFRWIGTRDHTYVSFWDGESWARAATPDPGLGATVRKVVAIAPTDVWAIGYSEHRDGSLRPMALHFDGSTWTRVDTPNPGKRAAPMDADAISPDDVWAVGTRSYPTRGFVLHYDGAKWSRVPLPEFFRSRYSELDAVEVVAPNDVWVVGNRNRKHGSSSVFLHWDGKDWSRHRMPDVSGTENFYDLDATGPLAVWAVGDRFVPDTPYPLAARWNGSSWERVPTPNPGVIGLLEAVAVDQAGGVWATGSRGNDDVMEFACKS